MHLCFAQRVTLSPQYSDVFMIKGYPVEVISYKVKTSKIYDVNLTDTTLRTILEYYENGYLKKEINFLLNVITNYSYYDYGRIKEIETIYLDENDTAKIIRKTYSKLYYNKQKLLKKFEFIDWYNKDTLISYYFYDNTNRIIKEKEFNKNKLLNEINYKYDTISKGERMIIKVIREILEYKNEEISEVDKDIFYISENERLLKYFTNKGNYSIYFYNEKNFLRVIYHILCYNQECVTNLDFTSTSIEEFVYNDANLLIRKEEYENNILRNIELYEYNEYGLLERIKYQSIKPNEKNELNKNTLGYTIYVYEYY